MIKTNIPSFVEDFVTHHATLQKGFHIIKEKEALKTTQVFEQNRKLNTFHQSRWTVCLQYEQYLYIGKATGQNGHCCKQMIR